MQSRAPGAGGADSQPGVAKVSIAELNDPFRSFWEAGYAAIMVTDTAPFRNKNYHRLNDTPETLDYDRMARVAHGLGS